MSLFAIFKVPQAKMLDTFFQNKDEEYSIRQLMKLTKVPRRTLERHLPLLVKAGLILKYHPSWDGHVNLYRFNGHNLLAQQLAAVSRGTAK